VKYYFAILFAVMIMFKLTYINDSLDNIERIEQLKWRRDSIENCNLEDSMTSIKEKDKTHIRRTNINPFFMGDGVGKTTMVIDNGYVYKYLNREWVLVRQANLEDINFLPVVYDDSIK